MKQLITFTLLLFCMIAGAQTVADKIAADIKKLSGEYMTDFRNIKGGLKSENEQEIIFYSRLKVNGSADSSNLLHFIKERQCWIFSAELDKEKTTAAELDTAISAIIFSFGKLKNTPTGATWVNSYIPAAKKGLSEKIQSLSLHVFNNEANPADSTGGGKLSFTLGHDEYYRYK